MSVVKALREIRDAIQISSTALDTEYIYIELWRAKPQWWALPEEERQAKMQEIQPGTIPGATLLTAIINEAQERRAPFDYFSVWKIETKEQIRQVEQRVESLGWWYEHWEEIHAWGKKQGNEVVGGHMIFNAPENPPEKPAEYALVETFKPKASWFKLSKAERERIFADLTAGVGEALGRGTPPEMFLNRPDEQHHSDWKAVILFRFPDKEAIDEFLPGINQLKGWFENVDFRRVSGELLPNPGPVIAAMVNAKK